VTRIERQFIEAQRARSSEIPDDVIARIARAEAERMVDSYLEAPWLLEAHGGRIPDLDVADRSE